ncbi:vancomycin high temperature exclusion protein [Prosthecobacter sp.]|uniref:vancomycin high temperature exclusion protein n=1 Tax=Prosthecobacter sp. TaxID=1965333 RepID=UPI0037851C62
MKTRSPSRPLLKIVRTLTLLAIGCTCLAQAWKRKDRLSRLVLEATRQLTRTDIFSEQQVPAAQQVALVPGTSIRGSLLRERVEAAARLYHAGLVSHLILSGDGRCPSYHEPHAMRRMLQGLGVPDYAMVEDPAGLSTYDSIHRAGQIAAGRRLVIVTQELYCPRSLLLARGLGVPAIACSIPNQPRETSLAREEAACVRAVLDLAGLRDWTEAWEQHGSKHLTLLPKASTQS